MSNTTNLHKFTRCQECIFFKTAILRENIDYSQWDVFLAIRSTSLPINLLGFILDVTLSADTSIIAGVVLLKSSPSAFGTEELVERVEDIEFSTVFAVSSNIGLVKFISTDSGGWTVVVAETETKCSFGRHYFFLIIYIL